MATLVQAVYNLGVTTNPLAIASTGAGNLLLVVSQNWENDDVISGITDDVMTDVFKTCNALSTNVNATGNLEIWYCITNGGATGISITNIADLSDIYVFEFSPSHGKTWQFSNNGAALINASPSDTITCPSVTTVGPDSLVIGAASDAADEIIVTGALPNGGFTFTTTLSVIGDGQEVGYLSDAAQGTYAAKVQMESTSPAPLGSSASFAQNTPAPPPQIYVQTNAPYPNRIQLVITPFVGPLVQNGPLGLFDPRRDLQVYVDGALQTVQTFSFDAVNNRYLLFMANAINLQGVIQVVHHVPSPPFQTTISTNVFSSIFIDNFATDSNQYPLNPVHWTVPTWAGFGLQVLDNSCSSIDLNQDSEIYTASGLPNNQYAKVVIGSAVQPSTLWVWLRSGNAVYPNPGYIFQVAIDPENSIYSCQFMSQAHGVIGGAVALAGVNTGDSFVAYVLGNTLTATQNGVQVISVVDTNSLFSSGTAGITLTYTG